MIVKNVSVKCIKLKFIVYSKLHNISAADESNFILSAGAGDKIQTDPTLDGFEYFLEKGKEKEDDLHKSYNDRSYLSSEEVGSGESRTGEWQPAWTRQHGIKSQLWLKITHLKYNVYMV